MRCINEGTFVEGEFKWYDFSGMQESHEEAPSWEAIFTCLWSLGRSKFVVDSMKDSFYNGGYGGHQISFQQIRTSGLGPTRSSCCCSTTLAIGAQIFWDKQHSWVDSWWGWGMPMPPSLMGNTNKSHSSSVIETAGMNFVLYSTIVIL